MIIYRYIQALAMPSQPKITGLLHNCSMNCGLPTIISKISWLAWCEQNNGLEQLHSDSIYINYNLIKKLFVQYYGIEEQEQFTWGHFNTFINKYSFSALQLVFAPILRDFIAHHALNNNYQPHQLSALCDIQDSQNTLFYVWHGLPVKVRRSSGYSECYVWYENTLAYIDSDGKTTENLIVPEYFVKWISAKQEQYVKEQYVTLLPEILNELKQLNPGHNPNHINYDEALASGHYNSLEYSEVCKLFYNPLGIIPDVYEFNHVDESNHQRIEYVLQPRSQFLYMQSGPLAVQEPIKLYLKNAHFELLPHEQVHQTPQSRSESKEDLNLIQKKISLSNSAYQTNQALGMLIVDVRSKLVEVLQASVSTTKISDLFVSVEIYAKTGRELHSDTALGNQTFAMILLILLEETYQDTPNVERLKHFLEHHAHHKQIGEVAKTIIAAIANTDPVILPTTHQLEEQIKNDDESLLILTAVFSLKCMRALCITGGILLVTALVMSPLLASTIGLTGLLSSTILTTTSYVATGVGTASLLSGFGIYAYQNWQFNKPNRPEDPAFNR